LGGLSIFFAFGGAVFSDAAGFVGLGILSTLDGFANTEIFLIDVGSFSGFFEEGCSSDNVTLLVVGSLVGVGFLRGDFSTIGSFSTEAGLGVDAGTLAVGVSFAD
jgi:hypothetical protein